MPLSNASRLASCYLPLILILCLATPSWAGLTLPRGVEASFTSAGNSSGYCVRAKLINTLGTTNAAHIPAGTYLHSEDAQDILVTRDVFVELAPQETKEVELYGFCTQPTERTPVNGAAFKLKDANSSWTQIGKLLNERKFEDLDVEQSVVWGLAENFPLGAVRLNRNEEARIAEFIESQRQAEWPDYELEYGSLIDRPFTGELLEVRGIMAISPQRDYHNSALRVYAPDGEVIYEIFERRAIQKHVSYQFQFVISGSLLSHGSYRMVLEQGRTVIDEQVITI